MERIKNSQEILQEQFKVLMNDFETINNDWVRYDASKDYGASEKLDEADLRRREKKVILSILDFIKENPDFLRNSKNKQEIDFIAEEYLKNGDCIKYAAAIAYVLEIDPSKMGAGASSAVLSEIEKLRYDVLNN